MNCHPLYSRAVDLATSINASVWIVEPARGSPYIAYTAKQIRPGYVGLWPVLPITNASTL